MKHVNLTSGGVASAVGLFRLAERFGQENVISLFCDTKYEDPDLYRFNADVEAATGVRITTISDGRDPWQVFHDVRFLGNSQVDPCSKILKRELTKEWLKTNCVAGETTVYLGYYLDESDRLATSQKRLGAWNVDSALRWKPAMCEADARQFIVDRGIKLPSLYAKGFGHNNCGGRCVKGGHSHFERLLRTLPERYAEMEEKEQGMREFLQQDISILKDRRGGTAKPLTLRAFRERVEAGLAIPGLFDGITGCSCFAGEPEET